MTDYSTVIERMTLEQKAALLSAKNGWKRIIAGDIQISPLAFSDGKYGVCVGKGLQFYGSPTTRFPSPLNMARTWNTPLTARVADDIGNEARSLGVNALEAPEAGVMYGADRTGSSDVLSEDPYLSGRMLTAYVRGFEHNGVLATVPYGAAVARPLGESEKVMREIALMPYEMAVKDGGAEAVRLTERSCFGARACESEHLVSGILMKEWGFDGTVIANDDGSLNLFSAISKGTNLLSAESAEWEAQKIVKAVERFRKLSDDVRQGRAKPEQLSNAVRMGEALSEVALDNAVARLMAAADKHTMNPVDLPDAYESYPFNHPKMFDERKHGATAYEAACESMVLLKNAGVLPLSDSVRVAFMGEYLFKDLSDVEELHEFKSLDPDISARMFGKVDLEVIGCSKGYDRDATALQAAALLTDAKELADGADVVVVYLGQLGYKHTNGRLPDVQLDFLRRIKDSTSANIVAVYLGAQLVDMSWDELCDAVLIAGDPGQAGGKAILKVLSGAVTPSGKLTETVAGAEIPSAPVDGLYGYRMCQEINRREKYPFGFGLSYTRFEYSDLKITSKGVSFKITNTGDFAGAEIAQLYVGKQGAASTRTKRELKGFCKEFLQAGEARTVEIPFDSRTFRYYNTDTHSWEIEGGRYQIYVGNSSRSLPLTGEIEVAGSEAKVPAGGGYVRRDMPASVSPTVKKVVRKFSVKNLLGAIFSSAMIVVMALVAVVYFMIGQGIMTDLLNLSGDAEVGITIIAIFIWLAGLVGISIWLASSLSHIVTKKVFEIPNPAAEVKTVGYDSYTADTLYETDRERFHFDEKPEAVEEEEETVEEEEEVVETVAEAEEPAAETEEEIVAASDPVIKYVRIQHTAFEGIEAGIGELYSSLEAYASARGVIAREGELRRLFAAFMSSRVMTVRASDRAAARITMRAMAECFDMNVSFVNVDPADEHIYFMNTEESQGIVSAVNAALTAPEKPSIAVICGCGMTDISAFLGGLAEYVGTPDAPIEFAMPNGTLRRFKLPSNLWFVVDVSDEVCVETGKLCITTLHAIVPRVIDPDKETLTVGEDKIALHTYPITVSAVGHMIARCREDNYLSEKYWRKIDKLSEYIASKTRFKVTNKQLNVMEKYISVCVASGAEQEEAMDSVMSSLLLGGLTADDARRFNGDETLTEFMDSVFGADKDDRSRELVKLKGIK